MHPTRAQKSFSLPKRGLFSANLTVAPESSGSESSFIVTTKTAAKGNLSRFATQTQSSCHEEEDDPKQVKFPGSSGLLKLFPVEFDEPVLNRINSPSKLYQQSQSLTQQSERQYQSVDKKRSVTPFESSTERQDHQRNLSFSSVSLNRNDKDGKELNKVEKIEKLQKDGENAEKKETKTSVRQIPNLVQTKEIVKNASNTEIKGLNLSDSKKTIEPDKEVKRSKSILDSSRTRIKTEGDRSRPLTPNIMVKDKDDSRSYEKQLRRYAEKSYDRLFKVRGLNLSSTMSFSQDDFSKDLSMTSGSTNNLKKQSGGLVQGKLKSIVENIFDNQESPRDQTKAKAVSHPEFSEKEQVEIMKQVKTERKGSGRDVALSKGFLSKINGGANYQGAKNLSLKKIKFRDSQIKDRNSRALYS